MSALSHIDWMRRGDAVFTSRTKIGVDLLLTTTPKAIYRTPIFDPKTEHLSGKLPEGSPDGYAWMVWHGSRSDLTLGFGLDASGTWWMAPGAGVFASKQWKPGMASDVSPTAWMDTVESFTKDVVLPTIAAVVGTVAGGVGGVLAASAIVAATKIARGGRVSEAVVSTTRDALPSLVASGVFDKTIDQAKTYGLDKMIAYGQTLRVADERDAFAKASVLATAMVAQEKSLAELKAKYPAQADVIELAAKNQGAPLDIAMAIGGEEEKIAMDASLVRNAGGEPESPGVSVATVAGVGLGLGALAYFLL